MLAPLDKVDLGGIHRQQVTGPLKKRSSACTTTSKYSQEVQSSNRTFFFANRFFSVSSYACKYITKSAMGMCTDY